MQASKLIGGLLMPLPVIIILLGAGFLLLAGRRRRRAGGGLALAGLAGLLALSLPFPGEPMLARLEGTYPLLAEPPAAGWIVVLGGGARFGDDRPAAAQLGAGSLYRILEGVRLARALPGAQLVVSGCGSAALKAAVAAEMGVAGERIVIHEQPRNTFEEALAVAERVGEGRTIILVTSASHMRRAVALFRGQGLTVVPAPTGHVADPAARAEFLAAYLPRADNVFFLETVLREWLGLAWARLNGWTG